MGIIPLAPALAARSCSAESPSARPERIRVPRPRARMTARVVFMRKTESVACRRCGEKCPHHARQTECAQKGNGEPHVKLRHATVDEASSSEERGIDEYTAERPTSQCLRQRIVRRRQSRLDAYR